MGLWDSESGCPCSSPDWGVSQRQTRVGEKPHFYLRNAICWMWEQALEVISLQLLYWNPQRFWRQTDIWRAQQNPPHLLSLCDNQIFAEIKERIMQQNTIYSLKTSSLPVCVWRKPLHTCALPSLFIGSNYFGIINYIKKKKKSLAPYLSGLCLIVSLSIVNMLLSWGRESFTPNPNQTSIV